MKKMDQVDRTVLGTVESRILKKYCNTALQRSTSKISHVMFLLEYKIKIIFSSLGWGIILQIVPCAACPVGSRFRLTLLFKNALVFIDHYVKKKPFL